MRAFALGSGALVAAKLGFSARLPPVRCPAGMQLQGLRCCGTGQSTAAGACVGRASTCSAAQRLTERGTCVASHSVVRLPGGRLELGTADWDGNEGPRFLTVDVAPFRLDASEVTLQRWNECAARGACQARLGEDGVPIVNVSATEAATFCRERSGRLPSAAEWVFAAAGVEARRYAWGNSGLVCRRAAFGLVRGPCAEGSAAELAGSRPDGATPDGIHDLTGNVAEWTLETDGTYTARGGSFRSESAAQLKSWSVEPAAGPSSHIGFRCAYPP
jgi:formylglycine-generating enzyme required for sulfatase activity